VTALETTPKNPECIQWIQFNGYWMAGWPYDVCGRHTAWRFVVCFSGKCKLTFLPCANYLNMNADGHAVSTELYLCHAHMSAPLEPMTDFHET
jgi:hypothetical protein